MTHIPSVAETYAYLRQTVIDCQAKLRGIEHRFEIVQGGIDIHVSQDGLANRHFVSWEEMTQAPQLLPLRAGMAAGELVRMRTARDKWRFELAAPADG